ncbi:MAG: tRNA pseudouridine(55) synthase TruB [Candidatus Adiutrix sp.]|jgi:tRNA pseudouridine55 synthase|nr:tRNA pseudouridine(55) synthase TruB [Candidatus Adiutrix sp.]
MNGRSEGELQGLLLIDKPRNMTSHDVVARLRRLAGQKKIGHTGTLDPQATGLLAVLLGPATRLAPYLTEMRKTYQGRLELGLVTDTDDAAGRVLNRHPGPWPTESEVRRALLSGEGEIDQVPPAFSAVQVAGRRAYRAALAGAPLELRPRRVTAFRLELIRYEPPALDFIATVSSGYYIRALARDLGRGLGLGGGALTELRRTAVGPWTLDQAWTLEEAAAWTCDMWRARLRPAAEALPHWPTLVLAKPGLAGHFSQGRRLPAAGSAGRYKIMDDQGRLLGLGQIENGAVRESAATQPREPFLRPLRVFPVS